jgi:hypothetical protein
MATKVKPYERCDRKWLFLLNGIRNGKEEKVYRGH